VAEDQGSGQPGTNDDGPDRAADDAPGAPDVTNAGKEPTARSKIAAKIAPEGSHRQQALSKLAPDGTHRQHALAELKKVSAADIVMVVATIVGFWMLAGQFADLASMGDELKGAKWSLVVLAGLIGLLPHLTQAVGMRAAAAQPIPLRPLFAVSVANSFTGLVAGTVGITATNIRFFQKRGFEPSTALVAGVVNSLGGGAVQVLIIICALPTVISSFKASETGGGGDYGTMLAIVIGVGVVTGLIFVTPRVRHFIWHKVKPQIDSAKADVSRIWHKPKNLVVLFVANAIGQTLSATALWLCLQAFGQDVPLPTLLLLNTIGSLFGGLAPIPGGMGVIEATLIAGLTAVGVDPAIATSAVLSYRVVTSYLPPAWGWPTLVWLRHHDYL
jgi:uncharacterized membrane protein YbhN (UPF0104 family)